MIEGTYMSPVAELVSESVTDNRNTEKWSLYDILQGQATKKIHLFRCNYSLTLCYFCKTSTQYLNATNMYCFYTTYVFVFEVHNERAVASFLIRFSIIIWTMNVPIRKKLRSSIWFISPFLAIWPLSFTHLTNGRWFGHPI